jgi:hypothetical protein
MSDGGSKISWSSDGIFLISPASYRSPPKSWTHYQPTCSHPIDNSQLTVSVSLGPRSDSVAQLLEVNTRRLIADHATQPKLRGVKAWLAEPSGWGGGWRGWVHRAVGGGSLAAYSWGGTGSLIRPALIQHDHDCWAVEPAISDAHEI